MKHRTIALGIVLALTAACGTDDPARPPEATMIDAQAELGLGHGRGAEKLGFMSRNLYIGTDLDAVMQALVSPDPTDDFPALSGAIADLQVTAWPVRVNAIANEIARERPDVIGLQEVWKIDIDLRPLGMQVVIKQDFLANLTAALASRGLKYEVAAVGNAVSAAPMPGIAVLDRDVILVDKKRVKYSPASVVAQQFAANIGTVAPGVDVKRGWVSVDAVVDGTPMRIVNTHLEAGQSATLTQLRALQATQLVATFATQQRVVLLGDFNDVPGSPTYGVVTKAGLIDVWDALRPRQAGLTCCHVELLSNASAHGTFSQRIDYIFARGLAHKHGKLLGTAHLTGENAWDRIAGPASTIWPSDHAGLVTDILLLPHHKDKKGKKGQKHNKHNKRR